MRSTINMVLLLLIGLLSLAAVACSGGLSRSNAADLISRDADFSKPREETYRTGYVEGLTLQQMREAYNDSWRVYPAMQSAGYIETTDALNGINVTLTEKGRRESANWKCNVRYDGQTECWFPSLAREVVEVTGITEGDGTKADATFTWRWKPLNDVGKAMNLDAVTHQGRAAFQKYDDGWRVVAVDEGR